jgi:hypothetical protein
MKKISPLILRAVVVLLGVALVMAILYDVSHWKTGKVLAPVHGIDIRADNSSPRHYFADVAYARLPGNNWVRYRISHVGNTIQIELFYHLHWRDERLEWTYLYVDPHVWEITVALGSDFVSGVNYTVEANNVTVTFIA